MTTNQQIADTFDEVADLLEFQQANPFRVRAYRNGARTLRNLLEPLSEYVDEGKALTDIAGIGDDLADKIRTLLTQGSLPQLDELRGQVPHSVLALLRVPGLGPKKAATLYKELNIQNLEQLKAACEAHQVQQLKGFGAKTEEAILAGIDLAATADQRLLWAEADVVVQAIREHMASCRAIERLEFAGSYRRGKETVGDLDLLVTSSRPNDVMDHFAQLPTVREVIARGETKMSVRVEPSLQVDLRVVNNASFGAALQYFTGSKEHNVILRGRAKQQGLKINEYGVFSVPDAKTDSSAAPESDAGMTRATDAVQSAGSLVGAEEEEVYRVLGLPWIAPELREGRHEFEWADRDQLPPLIELSDLRGDLHMHTTSTDGTATIGEMVAAAQARGLEYIAITDHSKRVSVAGGLQPEQVLEQWRAIDELQAELGPTFRVLKGIECDILEDGAMDLPDDVLAQADWVIASVHFGQRQSRAQITERILGAIEHPSVHVIAHPTGRLLNRRERYEVDMDAVFAAAAKHKKYLELNANPRRLDLDDLHCAAAKEYGVPIVISSDAHSIPGLDVLRYGILQARRAGLTATDVVNTRPWKKI